MGVDFYTCTNCSYNFPDCGEYWTCECGSNWCSQPCTEKEGVEKDLKNHYNYLSCVHCTKDLSKREFSVYEILDWCLDKLDMTEEDVIAKLMGK